MKESRSRLVTFRLSESEYSRLKAACGPDRNSVSAIVRHTVLRWLETVTDQPNVDDRLGEISEKLGRVMRILNKREGTRD